MRINRIRVIYKVAVIDETPLFNRFIVKEKKQTSLISVTNLQLINFQQKLLHTKIVLLSPSIFLQVNINLNKT